MDSYTLSYEYANGVKMSYTQVFFHPRGMPGNGQSTYVYGTKGGVDLEKATAYWLAGGEPTVLAEPTREDSHAHMAAFLEFIRTGRKSPADIEVARACQAVADRLGAQPAQVAIAWLMTKVAGPIASATSVEQLREIMGAANLKLDSQTLDALDRASAPAVAAPV